MPAAHWRLEDRRAIAAGVLAVHVALLWLMQRQLLPSPDRPSVDAARLRMAVWLAPPEQAPRPEGRHAGSVGRAAESTRKRLSPTAAPPARHGPTPSVAGAPDPAAPGSAPVGEAPPDTTSLLDTAATRRAIRESALGPGSLAQQAVDEGAALRSSTAASRLPGAMQRSGKGDCAKGDFAGGGMGLLSLPFLAAAAVNGDCAK